MVRWALLGTFATATLIGVACAGARGVPVVVVVIPPPASASATPDAPPADGKAAENDSADSLIGKWREEFSGRAGCSDEIVVMRQGGGLTVKSADCNTKKPYVTQAVMLDGNELRVELLSPDSTMPLRYTLKRVNKGLLEGEVLVGDTDEPSRYQVKWVKVR